MRPTGVINTRQAEHRDIRFASIDELAAELERIQQAHNAGTLRTTGNWSPGQIFQHVSNLWKMALDGVDFKAPLILRLVCVPIRKSIVQKKPPRGMRLRGRSRSLEPAPEAPFEAGLADLRESLTRVTGGQAMDKPSALFGRLTHEQWLALNLNHSAMHLGFVHYPDV